MGNLFGIKRAVKRISESTSDVLTRLSKETTEIRTLLTETTNKTLQRIDEELTQARQFLTEKAWPEVNKTMTQIRGVTERADEFLVTSTFLAKAISLLVVLYAVYVTHSIISERRYSQRLQIRRVSSITTIVNTCFDIMFCLCLALAFSLVLQLLKEYLNIIWPHSISFIILIPSLSTLVFLLQHLMGILKGTFTLLMYIHYVAIEYPIRKSTDPVSKGNGYWRILPFLQIIDIILYPSILYGACSLTEYMWKSQESTLKRILTTYLVFYGAALLIGIIYNLIVFPFIRCLWACRAKRNLERKNK